MKKHCSGFTLVELLVVVGVISILLGLGMAQYQRFNRSQVLEQAAEELKTNLRLAQDKALAGEKHSSCCPTGTCGESEDYPLIGWHVERVSASEYRIYGECQSLTFSERTVGLEGGVEITANFKVTFQPLGKEVLLNQNPMVIELTNMEGDTETVKVTVSGEIK